jgi:hypothetical protein
MRRGISIFVRLSAVTLLPLLVGCQAVSFGNPNDRLLPPAVQGRPTSLAFDSPALNRALLAGPATQDLEEPPWYLYRNDARLSTVAGYYSPTFEQNVTYTYDRQSQTGRHVYDYYSSTTYTTRFQQSAR